MSRCEYIPYCEWFELKLGMRREEGLLTNFPKFHEDRATDTMFSQRCRKTYRTDLVCGLTWVKIQVYHNFQQLHFLARGQSEKEGFFGLFLRKV